MLLAVLPLAATCSLDHCPNSFWLNDAVLRRGQPRLVPSGKPLRELTKDYKTLKSCIELEKMVRLFMEIDRTIPQRSWFTAKEAAEYIGVTPITMYAYCRMRKNRPPMFRVAGKSKGVLRFPREEFIIWANGGFQKQG